MKCLLITREPPHTATTVFVCDARDHGAPIDRPLATVRLHLVTGPAEYCEDCAAWMLKVQAALGVEHVHLEEIPLPAQATTRHDREITL